LDIWRVSRLRGNIPMNGLYFHDFSSRRSARFGEHIMQLRLIFDAICYSLKTTDDNGRFIIAVWSLYREFVSDIHRKFSANCAYSFRRAELGFAKRLSWAFVMHTWHSEVHPRQVI